jgi:hypothetical protein
MKIEIINWALAKLLFWLKPTELIIIIYPRPEGRGN